MTTPSASSFYPDPRHRSFALGDDGPGLLMLHGFPGTPAELLPLGEALAARGYRVRAPRLPGFGADIASLGRRRWHDWLEAALEAYRALPPASSLLGYSMGGALAITLAARVGAEAPTRLVLLAPFWRMNDWRAGLLPFLSPFVKTLSPFKDADFSQPALRAALADIVPAADLSDASVQARLRRELVLPTRALAEVYKLGQEAYRRAPQVKAPTLVVQGRQDETVRAEDTRRLVLRLRDPRRLHELDGGHLLLGPQSAPLREVTGLVAAFMEEPEETLKG